MVGDLAIFMLKNGLNKDNILTEGASLSYPDSVIDFFKGMIGQPEGGFPKELQKIVLKDIEPITVRPGTLLPDVDFEEIKQHLRRSSILEGFSDFEMEQKAVSYASIPKSMRTTAPTSRPTTTSPPWRATSTSTACGRGRRPS